MIFIFENCAKYWSLSLLFQAISRFKLNEISKRKKKLQPFNLALGECVKGF